LENIFEIFIVRKKANTDASEIVNKIKYKFDFVRFGRSCEIATAEPVLVLLILYSVMKERPATIVLMLPNNVKNCFLLTETIFDPMTAACPDPRLGKNEHSGADIIAARVVLKRCGLVCFRVEISCFGIFCFLIMLVIKLDPPNKPVNKGRSGWLIGRFEFAIPRKPAKVNIMKAVSLDVFSVKIRKMEVVIKIKNIINWIDE